MAVDRSYIVANNRERARLRALVERLSDDGLSRRLGEHWTVAAALAHLTFWDRRALLMVERWEREHVASANEDATVLNDAALPQWLAIPPRIAAQQALEAAEAVDAKLAVASEATVAAILALEIPINLDRGEAHRSEHLDEIEQALLAP